MKTRLIFAFFFLVVILGQTSCGSSVDPQNNSSNPEGTSTPTTPDDLAATGISINQISLTWQDSASDATEFNIMRSTDGVNFTSADTVSGSVLAFTDTVPSAGTYYYEIVANNSAGNSSASNIANASTTSGGSSGTLTAVMGLFVSPGDHSPFGACPLNYSLIAYVADCTDGTCYGNQAICQQQHMISGSTDSTQVFTQIYVNNDASTRLFSDSLPGTVIPGGVANCYQGTCDGEQFFNYNASAWSSISSGSQVVSSFWMLGPGNPIALASSGGQAACPTSYTWVADFGDMLDGISRGVQSLCVSYVDHP
jgi:hypothetical protein